MACGLTVEHLSLQPSLPMKRVIILGRGASGKSTVARQLGQITGLSDVEIDKIFWQPGLVALPREKWIALQRQILAEKKEWILDGDLGPYDALDIRLQAPDTVVFLDFSFARCAWRAFRRSRERADFWLWMLQYHRKSRPPLMKAISEHAPNASLHLLHNPDEVSRFITELTRRQK
jgi:adenylate kinase family enzyme